MLLFSFGQNTNVTYMRAMSPTMRFAGLGYLPDRTMEFTVIHGHRAGEDPVEEPGSQLWGVLFEITDEEAEELDRSEGMDDGTPQQYRREPMTVVRADGEKVVAQVYVGNRTGRYRPNIAHLGDVLDWARFWQFPAEHIAMIERHLATATDGEPEPIED